VPGAEEQAGETPVDAESPAEPDIAPEVAADLDELGVRLPATGSREDRGDQDTDEDLF